ncbi:hypothetical protein HMPREF9005_0662 [Actinomyces sp. oral taxon 178 str. F0338]|nr:hypothetical protein HMPREF9005_0662 [Actinomyces sp. oral taxon 178 str. F0338]
MRLSFVVLGGLRAGLVRNASEFDGFGRIWVNPGRLRRILDHMPPKPVSQPETQTDFGPPAHSRHRATRATGPPTTGPPRDWGSISAHHHRISRSPAPALPPRTTSHPHTSRARRTASDNIKPHWSEESSPCAHNSGGAGAGAEDLANDPPVCAPSSRLPGRCPRPTGGDRANPADPPRSAAPSHRFRREGAAPPLTRGATPRTRT